MEVAKEKKWYKKWWGITIIAVTVIVVIGSTGDSPQPAGITPSNPDTQRLENIRNRKTNSIVFAEDVITKILKTPSTAKFVDVDAYELSNEQDVWAVNGYVDSQNTYGAMIRNQWEVQLDYRDGKGGTVRSVLFDGKKIQ